MKRAGNGRNDTARRRTGRMAERQVDPDRVEPGVDQRQGISARPRADLQRRPAKPTRADGLDEPAALLHPPLVEWTGIPSFLGVVVGSRLPLDRDHPRIVVHQPMLPVVRSKRTTIAFEVGVRLPSATLSSGTSTLASGK